MKYQRDPEARNVMPFLEEYFLKALLKFSQFVDAITEFIGKSIIWVRRVDLTLVDRIVKSMGWGGIRGVGHGAGATCSIFGLG